MAPAAIQKQRSSDRIVAQQITERRRSRIQQREAERLANFNANAAPPVRKERRGSCKYPKSDILMMKEIFDKYDADGSGSIDRAEFVKQLERQKAELKRFDGSKKDLAQRQAERGTEKGLFLVDLAESLFLVMDKNNDGTIEFAELLHLLYPLATHSEHKTMLSWVAKREVKPKVDTFKINDAQRAQLRAMFALYDKDRSGAIDVLEFRAAMARCGLDEQETEALFSEADVDGNGNMDFNEFSQMMQEALFERNTSTSSTMGAS